MSPFTDKLIKSYFIFLIMVLISLTWIVVNWPYTPQDAIADGVRLGPWGILIDIGLLLALLKIWLTKKDLQE